MGRRCIRPVGAEQHKDLVRLNLCRASCPAISSPLVRSNDPLLCRSTDLATPQALSDLHNHLSSGTQHGASATKSARCVGDRAEQSRNQYLWLHPTHVRCFFTTLDNRSKSQYRNKNSSWKQLNFGKKPLKYHYKVLTLLWGGFSDVFRAYPQTCYRGVSSKCTRCGTSASIYPPHPPLRPIDGHFAWGDSLSLWVLDQRSYVQNGNAAIETDVWITRIAVYIQYMNMSIDCFII